MEQEGFEARKRSLLEYIRQLKEISGSPVEEEDLYAAGFSERELGSVGWFDAPEPIKVHNTQKLEDYTPSRRDNLRSNVNSYLQDAGASKNLAAQISKGVAGERNPTDGGFGMGLADFTPLGMMFGVEEGVDTAKQGYNSGEVGKTALGVGEAALNVASALPVTKVLSKGVQKLADTFVDAHDPSVVRTFFGPTSKNADLNKLSVAKDLTEKGTSAEQIWKDTGWWNGPNGWRFEVDDSGMAIPEDAHSGTTHGFTSSLIEHPGFFNSLRPEASTTDFDGQVGRAFNVENGITTLGERDAWGGTRGSFSEGASKFDSPKIVARGDNPEDQKETLVHELQHAVQYVFGDRAKGANPGWINEMFSQTYRATPVEIRPAIRLSTELGFKKARRADLVARMETYSQKFSKKGLGKHLPYTDDEFLSLAERAEINSTIESLDEQIPELESVVASYLDDYPDLGSYLKELETLGEGIGKQTFSQAGKSFALTESNIFDNKSQSLKSWAAHSLYELEGGELEARVAGNRSKLTGPQRAVRVPSKDYDVSDLENVYSVEDLSSWLNDVERVSNRSSQASKNGYAEGGVVEEVDPISGNTIPPGAEPKEVRDDIDAKLSDGEYVIPADVVRFLGLDKIEKLVSQAKDRLSEMASEGRIGGKPVEEEDDLPFSDEELMLGDEPVAMAVGGLVVDPAKQVRDRTKATTGTPTEPPTSTLPLWMLDTPSGNPLGSPSGDTVLDRRNEPTRTGIGASVDTWSAKDFTSAVKQRSDPALALVEQGVQALMPFGGLVMKASHSYLDKNVPKAIDAMLTSGVDKDGTPLTEQQVAELTQAKEDFVATKGHKPGLKGFIKDVVAPAFKTKDQKKTAVEETKKTDVTKQEGVTSSRGGVGAGSSQNNSSQSTRDRTESRR